MFCDLHIGCLEFTKCGTAYQSRETRVSSVAYIFGSQLKAQEVCYLGDQRAPVALLDNAALFSA